MVSSGKHKLNPSVEEYWRLINIGQLDQTYQENLFEIPMGLNKSGELGYTIGYRINGASSLLSVIRRRRYPPRSDLCYFTTFYRQKHQSI